MLTITARCTTLTPMLSAGANPGQRFELRAAGVKGALRFWWRAFHAFQTEVEMYNVESRIFGGRIRNPTPPPDWISLAAPFRLRIIDHTKPQCLCLTPGAEITEEWGIGIRYCLWPIIKTKQKRYYLQVGENGRRVLKPGHEFSLCFQFSTRGIEIFPDVLRSLWLIENLGGLGGRTRRGAGSFRIIDFDPPLTSLGLNELPDFDSSAYADPGTFCKTNIDRIVSPWIPEIPSDFPSYTAFRPGISEIHVLMDPKDACSQGDGALKAMDAVGGRMMAFRKRNPFEEARDMHHALSDEGNSPPPITKLQKAQFGLPIVYNFRGRGQFNTDGKPYYTSGYTAQGIVWDDKAGTPASDQSNSVNRRASPLLISCHVWKGTTPYAVVCHFPAPIVPHDQRIWLNCKYCVEKHAYPEAPSPHEHDLTDQLIGKNVKTQKDCEKSLGSGFWKQMPVYERNGQNATAAGMASMRPVGEAFEMPEGLSAEEQTAWKYLVNAPQPVTGLSWHLAKVIGKPVGSRKNMRWPCRLWFLDGQELRPDAETWHVRKKQLTSAPGLKIEKGTWIYCTTKAAAADNPNPEQRYLYNVRKTKR